MLYGKVPPYSLKKIDSFSTMLPQSMIFFFSFHFSFFQEESRINTPYEVYLCLPLEGEKYNTYLCQRNIKFNIKNLYTNNISLIKKDGST